MNTKRSKQGRSVRQTGAETARVRTGYERLGVAGTKKAYAKLNENLEKLAAAVIHTVDQAIPYLEKMQALLSQRGADRKKVLKNAGLPRWTPWLKAYADKLDRSMRTVQDRIKQFRQLRRKGTEEQPTKAKGSGSRNRLRLSAREQAALIKSQIAANDLAAALRNGADWQAALAQYDKVAVTPSKLDELVNVLGSEPDWKVILTGLSNTLGECDELPAAAKAALAEVRRLLGGSSGVNKSRSEGEGATNPSSVEASESPERAGDGGTVTEPEFAGEESWAISAPPDGAPVQPSQEVAESQAGGSESSEDRDKALQADPSEKQLRRKLQKAAAAKRYKLKKKAEKEARTSQISAARLPGIEGQGSPALKPRELTNGAESTEASGLMPPTEAVSIGLGL